jgi:hypothetical protein
VLPRWQIAGLILLALAAAALGIYDSPNSYAYKFLTGQCSHAPVPAACHPRVGRY